MKRKNIKKLIKFNIGSQLSGKYQAPLIIEGDPGISKTSLIKEVCEELNYRHIYFSIPSMPTERFTGLPSDKETKYGIATQWSIPEIVEITNDSDRTTVISFEDIHAISESLMTYLFELLTEKKIGSHRMKSNVAIVGTMNGSENSGFEGFYGAIRNRLAIVHMDMEFEEWMDSFGYRLNPLVTGFLKQNRNFFQEIESVGLNGFGTPRSWEAVSNLIDIIEKDEDFLSLNSLDIFKGYISIDAAVEFAKYINYVFAINFENKVKNREKLELDDIRNQALYSYIVKYVNTEEEGKYLLKEMVSNVDKKLFISLVFGNIYSRHRNNDCSEGHTYIIDRITSNEDKQDELCEIINMCINVLE